jgi:hypothetical protein
MIMIIKIGLPLLAHELKFYLIIKLINLISILDTFMIILAHELKFYLIMGIIHYIK